MKYTSALVASLLVVCTCAALADPPGWQYTKGNRRHYEKALIDGSLLQATVIDQSKGQNPNNNKLHYDITTLVSARPFGRWTYQTDIDSSLDETRFHGRFVLRLLDTGETLIVTYNTQAGHGHGEYCITAGSNTLVLSEPLQSQTVQQLASFVGSAQYSAQFSKGLTLFRVLAYTHPQLELYTLPFDLMYGSQDPTTSPVVTLNLVPVDCAFDAGFGFPCASSESPSDPRGLRYERQLY